MVENRNINEKVQVGESRLKQGLSYKVPERSEMERGCAPLRWRTRKAHKIVFYKVTIHLFVTQHFILLYCLS